MSEEKRLSPKQQEVMKWLVGGHQPYVRYGATVYINGQKLCNLDTMAVLEKRGFAERVARFQWHITAQGAAHMEGLAR